MPTRFLKGISGLGELRAERRDFLFLRAGAGRWGGHGMRSPGVVANTPEQRIESAVEGDGFCMGQKVGR